MDVNKETMRVMAVEERVPGLTKRYIEHNGTFVTIENYLINFFPNEIEFNADKMAEMLSSRADQADKKFEELKNEIYATVLSDAKYREPVQKTATESMTFVDYLEGLPAHVVTKDGVRFGNTIRTYESLFARFVEDRYLVEELENVVEPTKEEQDKAIKQNMATKILEAVLEKNGMNPEFVLSNSAFAEVFYGEFLDSIKDFDSFLNDGSLANMITELVSKYVIAKDDTTAVDKLEEMEIVDNGKTVTTSSLMKLDNAELAALIEEYNMKPSRVSGTTVVAYEGGDDDEEVETIEEPEVEVQLKAK